MGTELAMSPPSALPMSTSTKALVETNSAISTCHCRAVCLVPLSHHTSRAVISSFVCSRVWYTPPLSEDMDSISRVSPSAYTAPIIPKTARHFGCQHSRTPATPSPQNAARFIKMIVKNLFMNTGAFLA